MPVKKSLSNWVQEHFAKYISTTHPRCHSLLQGKASSLSAARVQLQLLSWGHKQGWANVDPDTGRSSSGRQKIIHFCSRRLPGLCRGCQGRQGCTLIKNIISQMAARSATKMWKCWQGKNFYIVLVPPALPCCPKCRWVNLYDLICKNVRLK